MEVSSTAVTPELDSDALTNNCTAQMQPAVHRGVPNSGVMGLCVGVRGQESNKLTWHPPQGAFLEGERVFCLERQ